jgi:hypothetical protein
LILVIPFAFALLRDGRWRTDDLALALLLYAFCCTIVLFFFPGVRVRYSMPAVLALAAAAGLAFERLRSEQPRLVNGALAVIGGLAIYQIVLSWIVMPAAPQKFERSRAIAQAVESAIRTEPATLYGLAPDFNKNVFAYIRAPIRVVWTREFRAQPRPAWILVSRHLAQQLQKADPQLSFQLRAVFDDPAATELILVRDK